MKKKIVIIPIVLSLGILLAACDQSNLSSNHAINDDSSDTSVSSDNNENNVTKTTNDENNSIKEVPHEFNLALREADILGQTLPVSEDYVYQYLTKNKGYSDESVEYALKSIDIDWEFNAFGKAQNYKAFYSMTPELIYAELIEKDGFTEEQALKALSKF